MKYNIHEIEQWVKLYVDGYDAFLIKHNKIYIVGSSIFISCNEKTIPYELFFSNSCQCITFINCQLLENVDIQLFNESYEGVCEESKIFEETICIIDCPNLSVEKFNIKHFSGISISDAQFFNIKSLYICESTYLTFKYAGNDVANMDNYIPLNNKSLILQTHKNISNILSLLETQITYVNFLTPQPNFTGCSIKENYLKLSHIMSKYLIHSNKLEYIMNATVELIDCGFESLL